MIITPNQSDIFTALRSFLISVLPAGTPVRRGQENRVAEPPQSNYVVMWPLRVPRIATNVEAFLDVAFTGSIAAGLLDVTAILPKPSAWIAQAPLSVGSAVYGVGLDAATVISALGSGTGGIGTYNVTPSQTVSAETMATGTRQVTQAGEFVIQLDIHGTIAMDNAQLISTLFRDPYGTEFFAALNPNMAPLYADDPQQTPFINGEQQFEDRYTIEAHLEANQSVTLQQQFADELLFTIHNVLVDHPYT